MTIKDRVPLMADRRAPAAERGSGRANWSARLLGVAVTALLAGAAGVAGWLFLGGSPAEQASLDLPRVEMTVPRADDARADDASADDASAAPDAALTKRMATPNSGAANTPAADTSGQPVQGQPVQDQPAQGEAAAKIESAEVQSGEGKDEAEAEWQDRAEQATADALAAINADDTKPGNTKPAPAPQETSQGEAGQGGTGKSGAVRIVLGDAPDPALVEQSRLGPLPIIDARGREPWQVYARPFDRTDKRPRVAIVVTDLGFNNKATRTAIALPGAVTLAFNPYAPDLEDWVGKARAAGHEVLLEMPMEPVSYPRDDPGPHTLRTDLGEVANLERMQWVMSRFTGYVGVINHMGSKFTRSPKHLRPVMNELKRRGLLYLDSRSGANSLGADVATEVGVPRSINNRFVDQVASRDAIDRRLIQVENLAVKDGTAVGVGHTFPVTLERLTTWIAALEDKSIVLVPVSATVNRQVAS